jgi:hypothetical protein
MALHALWSGEIQITQFAARLQPAPLEEPQGRTAGPALLGSRCSGLAMVGTSVMAVGGEYSHGRSEL